MSLSAFRHHVSSTPIFFFSTTETSCPWTRHKIPFSLLHFIKICNISSPLITSLYGTRFLPIVLVCYFLSFFASIDLDQGEIFFIILSVGRLLCSIAPFLSLEAKNERQKGEIRTRYRSFGHSLFAALLSPSFWERIVSSSVLA